MPVAAIHITWVFSKDLNFISRFQPVRKWWHGRYVCTTLSTSAVFGVSDLLLTPDLTILKFWKVWMPCQRWCVVLWLANFRVFAFSRWKILREIFPVSWGLEVGVSGGPALTQPVLKSRVRVRYSRLLHGVRPPTTTLHAFYFCYYPHPCGMCDYLRKGVGVL